jgi:hypothetical protein
VASNLVRLEGHPLTPRPPYYVPDQRPRDGWWRVLRHAEYEDTTAPVGTFRTRAAARKAAVDANEAWVVSQGVR